MTVTSLTKSLMEGFNRFALSAFSPQTGLGRDSLRQGLDLGEAESRKEDNGTTGHFKVVLIICCFLSHEVM